MMTTLQVPARVQVRVSDMLGGLPLRRLCDACEKYAPRYDMPVSGYEPMMPMTWTRGVIGEGVSWSGVDSGRSEIATSHKLRKASAGSRTDARRAVFQREEYGDLRACLKAEMAARQITLTADKSGNSNSNSSP